MNNKWCTVGRKDIFRKVVPINDVGCVPLSSFAVPGSRVDESVVAAISCCQRIQSQWKKI